MKIGVFDSGVGGQSVANAIRKAIPDIEIVVREDKEHLPYGSKSPDELVKFVKPILQSMIEGGCNVVVIACNTVTTNIINELRADFRIPFVAIEPMVKPAAAMSKSKVITICATPATLKSKRYRDLKNEFAKDVEVLEPDCSDWTAMIESRQIDRKKIDSRIKETLDKGSDVIALGCTHYHWIEDEIIEIAKDRARVIQPEQATIEQLKRVLARLT